MNSARPRWEVVARVVDQALDLDPTDRPAFLQRVIGGDAELLAEVERLLAASPGVGFLAQPAASDVASLVSWVARQESQALAAGTRLGAYEVTGLLGRGGMAAVYSARDHKHHRTVALKVFDGEVGAAVGREWFLREIDVTAQLHHPHILPLHDSGAFGDLLYDVMPEIEGESLRQRLARDGPLPLAVARRVVREVAGALDYAHRHGVVHRDVKPENILLPDGQALVADFGIARAIADGAAEAGTADTIPALGTPAYMSPEQGSGGPVDARGDVYALGCVAYEMLAGVPPFGGPNAQAILQQHAAAPVPSLCRLRPDLPAAVDDAIARALRKPPEERFATAGELAGALDGATIPDSTRGSAPRRRWSAAAAVLIAGAAVGYAGWRTAHAAVRHPSVVAILPFHTSAADPRLRWLGEGMVDLLSAKLSGSGEIRAVDPRSVLNAVRRAGPDAELPLGAALDIAGRVGAGGIIDGAVVGTPEDLTAIASLLSAPGGRTIAHASVEGPAESLSTLVDRLAVELLSLGAGVDASRLSSLTTTSLPAIRDYLAGRAAFRQGHFDAAFRWFRDATYLDSTFVLAAFEATHVAAWGLTNSKDQEDAARAQRLARAGFDRLSPIDRALLVSWAGPLSATVQQHIAHRVALTRAYPDRSETWYWLGDAYYHQGLNAGLGDRLRLASDAFRRGWAVDSAASEDSLSLVHSPVLAEMLVHMVEIAQMRGDSTSVRRLAGLALAGDSTSEQAFYLRWHRALAGGDSAQRAFWASASPGQVGGPGVEFITWSGVGLGDYQRWAELVTRRKESYAGQGTPELASVLLNGGRPGEALRSMPLADSSEDDLRTRILNALYWDWDTTQAAGAARRLASRVSRPVVRGEEGRQWIRDLCVLATWRLDHGDYEYAHAAARRIRETRLSGLGADSIDYSGYTQLCAALLDAGRSTVLGLPDARGRLDEADQATMPGWSVYTLPAHLIIARLAQRQGDLRLALRSLRQRDGAYVKLPWYFSTFLREEGRMAALAGDTVGAIRAYQWYLTLRPSPEPEIRPQVERVRAELARLQRGST